MSSSSGQIPGTDGPAAPGTHPRSPTRCATCGARGNPDKTPRNLVVCIDGTANHFGRNNTNVVKLLEAVDCGNKDYEQCVYYSSGIGTRPKTLNLWKRMKRAVADKLNMAIAWNTKEIVKEAYTWLAGKYQEGDQIYFFGFSRGAYQVRVLAWMIYEVGLIKNPTEKQIGTAYDHFKSILSLESNASDIARQFKTTFSWTDVRVHFIGVWDTVSSVGFGRGDVCLSASSAAAHACHIRHALALDECRVKFMPEYFFEMNSPDLQNSVGDGQPKSCGAETSNENGSRRPDEPEMVTYTMNATTSAGDFRDSGFVDVAFDEWDKLSATTPRAQRNAIPCAQSSCDGHTDQRAADIKEVWFAGSHSDVGGMHRPGKAFHAGNVSLMWMRQEASTSGLNLKPGDILWTAEDLNFGTTNSMTLFWKLAEIFPVRHQVSFSGDGENAWRFHLFKPRRIIPGQRIHASVQFANTYIPKATFGNGSGDILKTAQPTLSGEGDIWEKGPIDHMAYVALCDYLTERQGVAPYYLHKLLFMLRSMDGQLPTKGVPCLRKTLNGLITAEKRGLTRLVAIAAYFEALGSADLTETLSDAVFEETASSLTGLLKSDQEDWPRAVALIRPLAKHRHLRDAILTAEVIDGFLQLLDDPIATQGEHFAHMMDALSSLVELHPNSKSIIQRIVESSDGTKDRLSQMLDTNNSRHITAVLRVIICLTKKEPLCCRKVVPRLHKLTKRKKEPFKLLAIQALTEILHAELPPELRTFDLLRRVGSRASHSRHLSEGTAVETSLDQQFNAESLTSDHGKFIQNLLIAADGRRTQARTAATFTLLKLCEDNDDLRSYLLKKGLLDIFIRRLQFRNSALLAAYALTRCLSHSSEALSTRINQDPDLAGYIINMIRLDYFDDAIGVIEGFTIFEKLLWCDGLKLRILGYDIGALLEDKLGAGKRGKMRTGLIYLNIFRTHYGDKMTQDLVERAIFQLKTSHWRSQKAGVAILYSLAQTWFGVEAVEQAMPEVVDLILPTHNSSQEATSVPHISQSKPPSSLLGPALVLRILAENETLRTAIRRMEQYGRLKHLYLFGDLLGAEETPLWQIKTPTKDDVLDVISQMIRSVDSAQGPTNLRFVLPHVRHWDRITSPLRDIVVERIVVPPIVAAVAVPTLVVGAIIYSLVSSYRKVAELAGSRWRLRRQNAIIRRLRISSSSAPQIAMNGDWLPDPAFGDVLLQLR